MSARGKSSWKLCEFVAHSSSVNCLALSPSNGRTLATGGEDRRINLWMVGQPNALMSISGITSPVQSVAFNNTENWIGAGSKSGVIKVFDLEENKTVRSISGHKAAICSLDFHRYGDILASGSMDTNLKLWDVRRKGCIFTYKGHSEVINSIQFSPDGKWVVSASSDSTAKLWDLSAGRKIADFKAHTGAVTSVQFHPKEFLLASASSDRTTKFWDLERFALVSETAPDAHGARCIRFHPDGAAILNGAQDSLRVYGWEPVMTHDVHHVPWGKVADMAISGEQLIGASFAQTNVSLWCVDVNPRSQARTLLSVARKNTTHCKQRAGPGNKAMLLICHGSVKLKPFSGEPSSPTEQGVPFSASGRKLFEYRQQEMQSQRPHTQASRPKQQQARHPSDEGGDSPPVEVKEEERKEIFATRQELVRTPPKKFPTPFLPPSENHPPVASVAPVAAHRRKLEPTDDIFKDFKPAPVVHPSHPKASHSNDSRVVAEIETNHTDVCQILQSRMAVLKQARAQWSVSEPKASLEVAINCGNQSALVDILNVLYLKRTLWTLDMAMLILPELNFLLKSKYSLYISCGCKILKLILKSFGPLIKSNMTAPPAQGGVDITREERYEKCHTCHSHLLSLREEAWRLSKDSGHASRVIREQSLLDAFSVLD